MDERSQARRDATALFLLCSYTTQFLHLRPRQKIGDLTFVTELNTYYLHAVVYTQFYHNYLPMFRIATSADASAIASLHALNWQSSYRGAMTDDYLDNEAPTERLKVWTDRLAQPSPAIQVAVAETGDGELMGFVCVFPNHSEEDGHLLDNLHVHSAYRGSGLGKRLMWYAAQWLLNTGHHGEIYLWVLSSNIPAIGFYEKMGGQPGRTEIHVFPGDQTTEAMMMSWQLIELVAGSQPE